MTPLRPILALTLALSGCALSARYPWDPQPVPPVDPTAEVIRALADVLKAQKLPPATPTPPPAATPKVCLDPTDRAVAIPCPTPEVIR